jgi:hypothetical protein
LNGSSAPNASLSDGLDYLLEAAIHSQANQRLHRDESTAPVLAEQDCNG